MKPNPPADFIYIEPPQRGYEVHCDACEMALGVYRLKRKAESVKRLHASEHAQRKAEELG